MDGEANSLLIASFLRLLDLLLHLHFQIINSGTHLINCNPIQVSITENINEE